MVDAPTLESLDAKLSTLLERAGQPPQRFLTVDGGAAYTSLSAESIRRLIGAGKLTALRPVKGRILLDRHQIDAYVLGSDRAPRTGRGRR